MWARIADLIIKFRLWLMIITVVITAFMAYKATKAEMTYDFVKVIPEDDPEFIYFQKFKQTFGEDGNILVVGLQDPTVFSDLKKFQAFYKLTKDIAKIDGVKESLSIPSIRVLTKDTVEKKFVLKSLFVRAPQTQKELDSLLKQAEEARFYDGLLLNTKTRATLIAVPIEKSVLNSPRRQEVVNSILAECEGFAKETGITLHYAGLPYVRAILAGELTKEVILFLVLSILVTCIILYLFFRSLYAVFFTLLVIIITVLWSQGTLVLLGYKITLLTGILPSLIIVISIPNCIYMFNKYHQEYRKHKDKIKAIHRIIEKIGFLTFMTNANTAVGFLVLYFTDISIIKEFGVVAGILSIATFLISIVIIPSLLFYLPAPSTKQLKHLDLSFLQKINTTLEGIVLRHKAWIYITTVILVGISIYGILQIRAVSYMVDDLPEKSNVKTDLAFFEKNFKGVMPLEIVIDLGKKKAVMKLSNLKKLDEFNTYLSSLEYVSPPLSILNIVKGAKQAFYNNNPEYYELPTNAEMPFILKYFGKGSENNDLLKSFVDSSGENVRFTAKVADVGTVKMNKLVAEIDAKTKVIFPDSAYKVHITGTTLLFLKGNEYLINDLSGSLIGAFVLISLMMAFIFTNVKMILISLVPNIIPMVVTAGIMGLFHITLKPSTALIFSISFGISIDSTIHYLSKYKQELYNTKGNVLAAVTRSLREAGVSMIYTSIVLFSGFIIFTFSKFGGTMALGLLTSITLFVAMFTNLMLLPALLLTFGRGNDAKFKEGQYSDDDEDYDDEIGAPKKIEPIPVNTEDGDKK